MPDTANRSISAGADSLSVFFPCYNEQDNIRRVYKSAAKVLGNLGVDYELILVDDGSTDQSRKLWRPLPPRSAGKGGPPPGQSQVTARPFNPASAPPPKRWSLTPTATASSIERASAAAAVDEAV